VTHTKEVRKKAARSASFRWDRCEFAKCTLLIDRASEQLAFTECVFRDCHIDSLEASASCRSNRLIISQSDRPYMPLKCILAANRFSRGALSPLPTLSSQPENYSFSAISTGGVVVYSLDLTQPPRTARALVNGGQLEHCKLTHVHLRPSFQFGPAGRVSANSARSVLARGFCRRLIKTSDRTGWTCRQVCCRR
jgi:hypothetical protein